MVELVDSGPALGGHNPYYDYRTGGGTKPYEAWAADQPQQQPDLGGLAGAPQQTPYPMPPMDRRASAYVPDQQDYMTPLNPNDPKGQAGQPAQYDDQGALTQSAIPYYDQGAYGISPGSPETETLADGTFRARHHGDFTDFNKGMEDFVQTNIDNTGWTPEGRGKTVLNPADPADPADPTGGGGGGGGGGNGGDPAVPTGGPKDADPNNPYQNPDGSWTYPDGSIKNDDGTPLDGDATDEWLAEEADRIERKKFIAGKMGIDWHQLDGTNWNELYAQWQIDQENGDETDLSDLGPTDAENRTSADERKQYIQQQMGLNNPNQLSGHNYNEIYAQWKLDGIIPDSIANQDTERGVGEDQQGNDIDHILYPQYVEYQETLSNNANGMNFTAWLHNLLSKQDGGAYGGGATEGGGLFSGVNPIGDNDVGQTEEGIYQSMLRGGFTGSIDDWRAAGSPDAGTAVTPVDYDYERANFDDYGAWAQEAGNGGKSYPDFVAETSEFGLKEGVTSDEVHDYFDDYQANGGRQSYFDWVRNGYQGAGGNVGSYADALRAETPTAPAPAAPAPAPAPETAPETESTASAEFLEEQAAREARLSYIAGKMGVSVDSLRGTNYNETYATWRDANA